MLKTFSRKKKKKGVGKKPCLSQSLQGSSGQDLRGFLKSDSPEWPQPMTPALPGRDIPGLTRRLTGKGGTVAGTCASQVASPGCKAQPLTMRRGICVLGRAQET